MRVFHLLSLAVAALLLPGCAGPEQKLGRGMRNVTELTRWGELSRSVEQSSLWDSPEYAYTTGVIQGFNRSVQRTFVGAFEIVTSPFPPYDKIYMRPADPVYPDSYRPKMIADSIVSPDAALGFSGGDVAPFIPGSRFRIFDY